MDATFTLLYPPSVNTYWRHVGSRVLISKKGREYRKAVCAMLVGRTALPGRLAVVMFAYPPDRRRRDIDNLTKASLDAMEHAGVYEDDSQIDVLAIHRREVVPGGRLEVEIAEVVL